MNANNNKFSILSGSSSTLMELELFCLMQWIQMQNAGALQMIITVHK